MKSDIEQLRELCNHALDMEQAGLVRIEDKSWLEIKSAHPDAIMRLGDYVILKPKKDL